MGCAYVSAHLTSASSVRVLCYPAKKGDAMDVLHAVMPACEPFFLGLVCSPLFISLVYSPVRNMSNIIGKSF